MGSHDPFGRFKHKLWPKKGSGVKLVVWFPTTKNQGSPLISLRVGGMQHIVKQLLTRATTLLQTSSQLKVCTQIYGPPKLQESQLWEFWDSHLGVLRQNDIWVLIPWPGTKYIIRGKVVASPKFGLWWVLWVCVCSWLVTKVLQLCTNQLIVWVVQVHVNNWIACQSS
jgi:hypothetical protein